MGSDKLNTASINNEVGLILTRSRRVVLDTDFGEMAVYIKAGTAGDVVWHNAETNETGVWALEAGEFVLVACTKILTTAIIDGNVETTTAGSLIWGTSADRIGNPANR